MGQHMKWFVLAGVALLGATMASGPSTAQRARLLPPEPSETALVSHATAQALAEAITAYEIIAANGGWPEIPGNRPLRKGDDDERVAVLKARLRATGDLVLPTRRATEFDEAVEQAVKTFQFRHGIEPNGVVHGLTLRSMNVPARERAAQLKSNLQRIHELLPRLSGRRYVVMNAASFELQAIEDGRVALASRTIVGKRQTPTPTISATVQAVNLLPYWHVPSSIAQAALVPAVRKDPGYLQRERIRVFSSFGGGELDPGQVNWWGPETQRLVFRQDPGPQNALGLIRLDMPNKAIVYMHDTPMKPLFNSFERAFSAGCVRVQSVFDLGGWLLADQGWTSERLEQTALAGRAETIKLSRPVPVHFIYLTAWADRTTVQFRNDLYNRDEAPDGPSADDGAVRLAGAQVAP